MGCRTKITVIQKLNSLVLIRGHQRKSAAILLSPYRKTPRTFSVNSRHAPTITPYGLGFAVFLWYFSPNRTYFRFPTAEEGLKLRITDFYGTRVWFQQSKGPGPSGEVRPAGEAPQCHHGIRKDHQGRPQGPHGTEHRGRSLRQDRQSRAGHLLLQASGRPVRAEWLHRKSHCHLQEAHQDRRLQP